MGRWGGERGECSQLRSAVFKAAAKERNSLLLPQAYALTSSVGIAFWQIAANSPLPFPPSTPHIKRKVSQLAPPQHRTRPRSPAPSPSA
jgi:hypothetical protein